MAQRILVVDDANDVRQWLKLSLEARGWAVTDADCGETALAAFDDADPPNFVVLDHMMPGMTGLEVGAQLRDRGYDGPIVLFSAYLSPGMSADLRRLDMTAVSKIDHTALFRVIDAAGRGRGAPAPGGTST
ncbi:MAG TPA: response regulator [Acidimicrobiales bacterium]|nr:response regulator [Acidimicrobiales bacterium]